MFSFFKQHYFVEETILVWFFLLDGLFKIFLRLFSCVLDIFFFSNSLLNLFINLSFVKFCYLCYLGDGLA